MGDPRDGRARAGLKRQPAVNAGAPSWRLSDQFKVAISRRRWSSARATWSPARGPLSRHQVWMTFAGADSKGAVRGANMLSGDQHADTTLVVNHQGTGCESRELFKPRDRRARHGPCSRPHQRRARRPEDRRQDDVVRRPPLRGGHDDEQARARDLRRRRAVRPRRRPAASLDRRPAVLPHGAGPAAVPRPKGAADRELSRRSRRGKISTTRSSGEALMGVVEAWLKGARLIPLTASLPLSQPVEGSWRRPWTPRTTVAPYRRRGQCVATSPILSQRSTASRWSTSTTPPRRKKPRAVIDAMSNASGDRLRQCPPRGCTTWRKRRHRGLRRPRARPCGSSSAPAPSTRSSSPATPPAAYNLRRRLLRAHGRGAR